MDEFTSGFAEGVRTFFVQTCPREHLGYSEPVSLPTHRFIVEPILRAAQEVRIYGSPPDLRLPPAVKRKGHLFLPLNGDLIRHMPEIWNGTGGWSIGSIVIETDLTIQTLEEIFYYCQGPDIWSSRYQMQKGNTNSALKFCERVALNDKISCLFSASNGIERMDLFMPVRRYEELWQLARKRCRTFKRYIEHNSDRDNELIVDRPPYRAEK